MKFLISSMLLLFISGCASVATYRAVDLAETEETYSAGLPYVISTKQQLNIAIGPAQVAQDPSQRHLFSIYIQNLSNEPVTVGPENLRLVTDDNKQFAAISAQQLQREAKRKAAWMALAAGMQTAGNNINAANAGYSYGTANYSGTTNIYGSGGYARANTYGTATYSGYDASAAANAQLAANAENRAIVAETRAQIDKIMYHAQQGAFQRQTLAPGSSYSSLVTFEEFPSSTQTVYIFFETALEEHRFAWSYSIDSK